MPIIHKVKQIATKASHWSALLLLVGIVLAPTQALAASKTYAVSCAGSDVKIVSGVLECSVAPAIPLVEGVGSAKRPFPSNAGVATVTVSCGRSSPVDPSVGNAANFRCKNNSSPTINNYSQLQSGTKTAPTPLPPISPGCNINGCDLVASYVQPIVNLLSGMVGIIVVISLIMGGIEYSTSEGDPQKSAKAKRRITNTLIALIAFFFLYGFLQFLIPNGVFH
jgi:hypothetical protein